jgi:hypothetical protein
VAELEATRNRALEAPAALDRAAADLRRKGERALSTSLTRLRVEQRAAARAALGSLLDPPSRFGPKSTVHRWFLKWVSAGVFESLMLAAGRCVEDTGGSGSTNVSSMALFPKPSVAAIALVDGRWILFRDAEHT